MVVAGFELGGRIMSISPWSGHWLIQFTYSRVAYSTVVESPPGSVVANLL